ncbi:MAG: Sialic acid TRAP transporter permease protein SiaT [Synergistetes bacterium ADurb.Bin155]|jgi:tripartite ATP-independent transporter DctM subunit|nr:TRAP transporter large permease [Synergistales bacterium]MBP8996112.1 TRAP transporter large permease [Synergistales bacterium]NMD17484.1 TRAP transporter large permease [Synergistaceae bacterium]OQB44677.1 MAG: Sialic acid TRAP transporter permease protein SiaT [Synergistetes bacterium ADurb.Bin155]
MVLFSLVLLVITLIIGVPVPFAFLVATTLLVITGGYSPSFLLPYGFSKMSTIVLLAIPLFIMAGGIMERGNIGDKLVDLVDLFVGRIKGGLGVVAVVSCAVFGSITGSACATLSCIGSIMFPRLEKAGYPRGHSAALLANASVLGMLIPPSAIMILYSWVGNQSVLASFLSSVIPGIILTILLSVINMFLLRNNKDLILATPISSKEKWSLFRVRGKRAIPALIMPVLVLGGIYGGIMTPTEAAAVAAVYSIPVGFWVYKGLTRKGFFEVLVESGTTTGVIMVMLYAVMILSRLYIMEDLPTQVLNLLMAVSTNRYAILFMINIFMVIMGMIMDDVSAVLLSTPILLPIIIKLGFSPVHFAAIVGVNLGMGNITPPAAPLLYLGGRVGNAPINEMLMPTVWMLIFGWLPTLALTTYVPGLATFLPNLILGVR